MAGERGVDAIGGFYSPVRGGRHMVLPEGSTVPPVEYLVPVGVLAGVAAAVLVRREVRVTDRHVLAAVPWMVAGAALHVLYVLDAVPAALEPLAGSPMVYLTVATVLALLWIVGLRVAEVETRLDVPMVVGGVGVGVALLSFVAVVWSAIGDHQLALGWPVIGLVVTVALTAAVYLGMRRWLARTLTVSGATGVIVVFGQVFDAVTTAIGVDWLDAGERSPLSEVVIDLGRELPVSEVIGDAWLFVVVKGVLAVAVLVLFRPYIEEAPTQARVILAVIAAVGLAPGTHNLLLYLVSV